MLARENATAKTISSLTIGIVLKFFPDRVSGILSLKDYPRVVFGLNPQHDSDISGIPEHSKCAKFYSSINGSVSQLGRLRNRLSPATSAIITRMLSPPDCSRVRLSRPPEGPDWMSCTKAESVFTLDVFVKGALVDTLTIIR